MARKRKPLYQDVRMIVLHEAGYRCAVPTCRTILTLDIHHMEYVSEGGGDTPDNLLALCPNCHALHHAGEIPRESIRAWKFLLLAMNEAFDRKSLDLLLAIRKLHSVTCSGDGILACSSIVSAALVHVEQGYDRMMGNWYRVTLNERGMRFVEAWSRGDQAGAVAALAVAG